MSMFLLSWILFLCIIVGCSTSNLFLAICMLELSMFTFLFMNYHYGFLGFVSSSIKYFLTQSVGSIFLFLGGLMMFLHLAGLMSNMFFLLGFMLKLGAFPLYFWVIPVNSALSYNMIGVLSSPMKLLPVAMMIQYFSIYLANNNMYIAIVVFSGVFSMTIGMFLGLGCKTVRAMLGASSITHTGWLLISMPVSYTWYYFSLYSLGVATFVISLFLESSTLSSLSLLCLSGLPPFSVFIAKLLVVSAWFFVSMSWVFLVPALATSAFSLYYYMKYSFVFFMLPRPPCSMLWVGSILFMLNFLVGCWLVFFFYSLA